MALGYTMALPTEDRYLQSKTEFEDKIAGLLGGNVAERLIFGDTTTGASNDIEKATDLARRMVTEFGMSDKLGPLSFGKRDELVFLGREMGEQRNYSDEVARTIDEEVRAIIDKAYERATEVLTTHRDKLIALAEKLVAEETVDAEGFEELFSDLPPKEDMHGIPTIIGPGPAGRPSRTRSRPDHRQHPATRTTSGPATARSFDSTAGPLRYDGRCRTMPPCPPTPPSSRTSTRPSDARLESYKAFLRIPSISALPAHADDCRAAAEWLADALTAAGLEHVEVVETGGHPVVYADWLHAPDAPTVLVYGHYDVQPVDPLDLWTSPPFEPVVVGDRILARGAADDKGQVHAHVMAAARAARDARQPPDQRASTCSRARRSRAPSTSTRWLEANRERLAADVAIISDTGFFEGNLPAITLSLRGMMYAQIDVVGTARRPPLRAATAAPSRTRPTRWPRSSPRSRAPTAGSGSRASTTTSCRCPRPTARRSPRCPFDEDAYLERARAPRARRRGRLHDARAARRRARRSTSTACGAASRARAARRSSRPTPTPRSAAGWWPPRIPTRSSRRSAAYVEEVAPPGVTTTVQLPRWRASRA